LTSTKQSDKIVRKIAFWAKDHVPASQLGVHYGQLPAMAERVLADNPRDHQLRLLLGQVGGDEAAQKDAMYRALLFINKAHCKHSSVYPDRWFAIYDRETAGIDLGMDISRLKAALDRTAVAA
jgi:hypothetical protein